MTKCTTFEQNLEAFLDGDLASADGIRMKKHKKDCISCQARLDRANRLDALLREGLVASAAMTPTEQVTLRQSVLARVQKPRSRSWPQWLPRPARVAAVLALALALIWGAALLSRNGAPSIPAAELIARAQAAMHEHTGLGGVLHWQTTLQQWGPWSDEVFDLGFEIWFDFDDPRRYRLRHEFEGVLIGDMVRDGIDHLWTYTNLAPFSEGESVPYVEEIMLSADEMQELAAWHVPAAARDELARFADMLPDVRVIDKSEMAGRPVYLLQGKLLTPETQFNRDGSPRPTEVIVTLAVDAETYWLLGREEQVPGEDRPRIIYRTQHFELSAPGQVPKDAFSFSPPAGASVRHLEGIDSIYRVPSLPSMPLEEAAAAAPFALLLPSALPDDLEALPYVLVDVGQPEKPVAEQDFIIIYQGKPGRQMLLVESALPKGSAFSARLVQIGDRQGWLESDLIDARQFTIYLSNWKLSELHAPLRSRPEGIAPGDRLPPGYVRLHAWGLSVDEAIAILESLMPY
jgi:hypothetical protein